MRTLVIGTSIPQLQKWIEDFCKTQPRRSWIIYWSSLRLERICDPARSVISLFVAEPHDHRIVGHEFDEINVLSGVDPELELQYRLRVRP